MSYTKAEQLYEGKAKKVFAIKENPDYVWYPTRTTLPLSTV